MALNAAVWSSNCWVCLRAAGSYQWISLSEMMSVIWDRSVWSVECLSCGQGGMALCLTLCTGAFEWQ